MDSAIGWFMAWGGLDPLNVLGGAENIAISIQSAIVDRAETWLHSFTEFYQISLIFF